MSMMSMKWSLLPAREVTSRTSFLGVEEYESSSDLQDAFSRPRLRVLMFREAERSVGVRGQ